MNPRCLRARRRHLLAGASALTLTALTLASPAAAATSRPAANPTGATQQAASTVSASTVRSPLGAALTAAYAAFRHIPARDVAGVRPGSLHTSYSAATGTHRATATFLPSAGDSASVLLGFQDEGSTGVFARRGAAAWRMTGFRAVHGLSTPRRSGHAVPSSVSASKIVQVANENVGVGDTPASTNFSFDCNPFATLVSAGASTSGCGTDPTHHVQDENQEWCADFAKWVWEQGGVTADTGVLNAAAASFYQWALDQGQHPAFDSGTPAVGDAIVFYPASDTAPNASYADHVGLVVGVNSNGTINMDNGDFAGSSNITVQANDNENPTTFAGAVWGAGEHWILVSPGASATSYVFWKGQGTGYDLWQAQGSSTGALSGPANHGMGPLNSAPAAAVDPANGYTYVYWEGQAPQDDLWEAYWNGSKWVGPYNRGMGPLGSAPTAAVSSSGTAYVFWKGQNNDLYEASGPATGTLSGPVNRGMGPLGSAPTVGINSSSYTYVYWEGTSPQDDLYEAYWNGSKFAGPYNRGMGPMGSAPSVAVTGGGTAYVFWKGQNSQLYEAQGAATGALSGPSSKGMGPLGSQPTAGVDSNGATYVYWEGTSPQDDLWEGYWNGTKWVGPYNRGMGPLDSAPSVAVYSG
jgi:CHAP domain